MDDIWLLIDDLFHALHKYAVLGQKPWMEPSKEYNRLHARYEHLKHLEEDDGTTGRGPSSESD